MAHHYQQDTTGSDFKRGSDVEDKFAAIARSYGYSVKEATRKQDMLEHFDFILQKDGKAPVTVEVKSMKNWPILHNGKSTKDFVIVEFRGITGHWGWLYGSAHWVAFERQDHFLLIPRSDLERISLKKVGTDWVERRENMLYNLYGRKDRLDEVSALLVSDIQPFAKIWK